MLLLEAFFSAWKLLWKTSLKSFVALFHDIPARKPYCISLIRHPNTVVGRLHLRVNTLWLSLRYAVSMAVNLQKDLEVKLGICQAIVGVTLGLCPYCRYSWSIRAQILERSSKMKEAWFRSMQSSQAPQPISKQACIARSCHAIADEVDSGRISREYRLGNAGCRM